MGNLTEPVGQIGNEMLVPFGVLFARPPKLVTRGGTYHNGAEYS